MNITAQKSNIFRIVYVVFITYVLSISLLVVPSVSWMNKYGIRVRMRSAMLQVDVFNNLSPSEIARMSGWSRAYPSGMPDIFPSLVVLNNKLRITFPLYLLCLLVIFCISRLNKKEFLHCTNCKYDLSGLNATESDHGIKCPECGVCNIGSVKVARQAGGTT